jgi:predicted nucleic acid-binding protein
MTVFVDTSALYALIDEGDDNHASAIEGFRALRGSELTTHTYVIVETLALVGRQLAWAATERILDMLFPLMDVIPVDDALHRAAALAYRESGSPRVSLVDRTSFAFMRRHGIRRAFAFDVDFAESGFDVVGR